MSEVQHSTQPGEMAQRFIELVMMQAQQAAMFLGQLPGPDGSQPQVNLEYARLFIDQLEMLQEKTRGNLSNEESQVLGGVLSDLRLAFVKASSGAPPEAQQSTEPSITPEPSLQVPEVSTEPEADSGSRKRFTKSYGS
jgi:hypothetical protein